MKKEFGVGGKWQSPEEYRETSEKSFYTSGERYRQDLSCVVVWEIRGLVEDF